jgi:hypothetical protein
MERPCPNETVAVVAAFVTQTSVGDSALAILVAVIGYFLHRKSSHIEVMVNGRMTALLTRVDQLEAAIRSNGHVVPPAPPTTYPDG